MNAPIASISQPTVGTIASPAPSSPAAASPLATPLPQPDSPNDPFFTQAQLGTLQLRSTQATLLRVGPYGARMGYGTLQSAIDAIGSLTQGNRPGVAVLQHDGRFYGFSVTEQVVDHRTTAGVRYQNLQLEHSQNPQLLAAGAHPDIVALVEGSTVVIANPQAPANN